MQSNKPSQSRAPKPANNHHRNPDQDEALQLLADVPAKRLPGLLQEVRRVARQGDKK